MSGANTSPVAPVPGDDELLIRVDTDLPSATAIGDGSAFLLQGACFHRRQDIRSMELVVDGEPQPGLTWGMPRPNLAAVVNAGGAGLEGLGERALGSGFWAVVALSGGAADLALRLVLEDGEHRVVPLGSIAAGDGVPAAPADGGGEIAICMAAYEPNPELFERQLRSIRAQSFTDWTCLIRDDCSSDTAWRVIEEAVAGDPRFAAIRGDENLGYYRNFEALLGLLPASSRLVALCDQDDEWHPDKLATLRSELKNAGLVYSDQRLVDADGTLRRSSMWEGRRNNHTNLESLLIANTVTGSASLFTREVAEAALPFPDPPGFQFHDHWVALTALSIGSIAYVDRPLYDYLQHGDAVVGQVTAAADHGDGPVARLRSWLRTARGMYYYGYVPAQVHAAALIARFGSRIEPGKRRALEHVLRADRSTSGFLRLLVRPLRMVRGATETLGVETDLTRGIAWRHAVRVVQRIAPLRARIPVDAECPPLEAADLGQRRVARWRRS